MAIRLPLTTILDVTNSDLGAASVAGGYAYPFNLPQDTDNVIVKFTPSVVTGGMSVFLQTSDDGGTTYYDVARTSIVSLRISGPQWISAPVISAGVNPRVVSPSAGSILGGAIGTANASTLGSQQVSGLPILGIANRVFLVSSGGNTANTGTRIQVMVNSQSATS